MISSKLVPILAAIDIALLAVIVISAGTSAGRTPEPDNTAYVAEQEITSPVSSSAQTEAPMQITTAAPETAAGAPPAPLEAIAEAEPEAPVQTIPEPAKPQETSAPAAPETAAPYEPLTSPTVPVSPKTENAGAPSAPLFDVTPFDTREKARLEDFNWVTSDIVAGICPPEAEDMVFIEALGGWKCYIWDATGTERLANMDFSGTEEALTLRFDWNYIHLGSEDQGYDDNTPDSVFRGSLVGNVEATGAGKVILTDFYRIDDHQYAFGTIMWPDGISGHLMLVRP